MLVYHAVSIDWIWLLCTGRSAGTSLEHEQKSRGEEEGPQTLGEESSHSAYTGIWDDPGENLHNLFGFQFSLLQDGLFTPLSEGIVRMKQWLSFMVLEELTATWPSRLDEKRCGCRECAVSWMCVSLQLSCCVSWSQGDSRRVNSGRWWGHEVEPSRWDWCHYKGEPREPLPASSRWGLQQEDAVCEPGSRSSSDIKSPNAWSLGHPASSWERWMSERL